MYKGAGAQVYMHIMQEQSRCRCMEVQEQNMRRCMEVQEHNRFIRIGVQDQYKCIEDELEHEKCRDQVTL